MDATASRFATHTQPPWPQQPPRAFARAVSLWQGKNFLTYVAMTEPRRHYFIDLTIRIVGVLRVIARRMFDFCALSNYGQWI